MTISILDQKFNRDDPAIYDFLQSALRRRSLGQGFDFAIDPISKQEIKPKRLFVKFNRTTIEFKVEKLRLNNIEDDIVQIRRHWNYCGTEMKRYTEKVKYLLKYYSLEGFRFADASEDFNSDKIFNSIMYKICTDYNKFAPDISTPMRD